MKENGEKMDKKLQEFNKTPEIEKLPKMSLIYGCPETECIVSHSVKVTSF